MLTISFVFLLGVIARSDSQQTTLRVSRNETTSPVSLNDSRRFSITTDDSIKHGVLNAVNYILNERHLDYSWGASTARAVVALMFARQIFPLDENEINLIKKQLTVQLYLDFLQEHKMSLSHLALSVNALYAMCEDPRNFQGMDLVQLLRTGTETGPKINSTSPLVLLTLCIAGESQYNDILKLSTMYEARGSDRIGYKALTLMAIICIKRSGKPFAEGIANHFQSIETDFFSRFQSLEDGNIDVYTKALFIQAANSAGRRTKAAKLLRHQLDDGSFGDLLATYYAIPALLNRSLLDLKCKKLDTYRDFAQGLRKSDSNENVTISIWILSEGVPNSHSMVLNFDEDDTLYDVMKRAEAQDSTFGFMWERTAKGMEVYGLAGIPSDTEGGKSWILYSGRSGIVKVNSKYGLQKETEGIGVKPKTGHNYVFWWEG